MGVFATRTPHRFNPIGLSIARLESVDLVNRCIHLSGIDLIEGTPVIDIKPYHYVDSLPPEQLKIPSWLEQTKDKDLHEVNLSLKALNDLQTLVDQDHLQFYKGPSALENALTLIKDVLSLNPHSVHTIAKYHAED